MSLGAAVHIRASLMLLLMINVHIFFNVLGYNDQKVTVLVVSVKTSITLQRLTTDSELQRHDSFFLSQLLGHIYQKS